MARTKGSSKNVSRTAPVEHIKHQDKRVNIPTNELRGFLAAEEHAPKEQLYPRDPSLDPQLVWKDKDAQDRAGLAVPTVPVYIQEKIHPKAIIENLRRIIKTEAQEAELALFSDFNGIKFEDLIEFYNHQQNWANRMILGDSLLVMNSLAEKENLKGKVQCIYMDPPYGIKFGSNWQVSTRKRDVKDGRAEDLTREPEQIRAFRDTWKLRIHSYLAYLRDRLTVAHDLLTETGSIFVQIGDENVHLVRCVMDEVFGSENSCAQIFFVKTSTLGSDLLSPVGDYLLWYAKDASSVKYRPLFTEKEAGEEGAASYTAVEMTDGRRGRFRDFGLQPGQPLPPGTKLFATTDMRSQSGGESSAFTVLMGGRAYKPNPGFWKTSKEGFARLIAANRLVDSAGTLRYVRYLDDFPVVPYNALWRDTATGSFTEDKVYVVQTAIKVVQRCILMTTDPGDLVLDPTCGSGTTAYVAEQWGRRWITCDTSRVALALARTRLMTAKYPYYLLADSPEGIKKESELTGKIPPSYKTEGDIRKGFVYKRVPHVIHIPHPFPPF
jgi:adenine-specific DNA-methyltransferase